MSNNFNMQEGSNLKDEPGSSIEYNMPVLSNFSVQSEMSAPSSFPVGPSNPAVSNFPAVSSGSKISNIQVGATSPAVSSFLVEPGTLAASNPRPLRKLHITDELPQMEILIGFEFLPEMFLERIFKLLLPNELFNLCFLNKNLYPIVRKVIKNNSIYSLYNLRMFKKYRFYQVSFIRANGEAMRYLNVNNDFISLINECPNVESIYFKSNKDDDISADFELTHEFPNLKRLAIKSFKYPQILKLFGNKLPQLEVLDIAGNLVFVNDFVKYIKDGPSQLKEFKLYSKSILYINGIDTFKRNCKRLELVDVGFRNEMQISTMIDNNLGFASNNVEVKIRGRCDNGTARCFGNLSQLRGLTILDDSGFFFKSENHNERYPVISEGHKITCLGQFGLHKEINIDFLRLSTLNEIHIRKLTRSLLTEIAKLPNIRTIRFTNMKFSYQRIYGKKNTADKNAYKPEYEPLKCRSVTKIEMDLFNAPIERLLYFLCLFPKLQRFVIDDFYLVKGVTRFNYQLDTPLNLTAPVPHKVNKLESKAVGPQYEEFERIPNLNWVRLNKSLFNLERR